jgi:hypothetical protein
LYFLEGEERTYVAQADIFHQLGIKIASRYYLSEEAVDNKIEIGVFESTLLALGQWCSDGQRNNHIVGILLCTVLTVSR